MRSTNHVRDLTTIVAPLLTAALMAGCGAASAPKATMSAALPSNPGEARAELTRLERRIARARLSLGLPARKETIATGKDEPRPAAPARLPAPAAPPADAEQSVAGVPQQAEQPTSEAEKSSACSDNCRISRAICHAARRICSIAAYLGDDDAAGRCKRARKDCKDARQAKPDSCSGCS